MSARRVTILLVAVAAVLAGAPIVTTAPSYAWAARAAKRVIKIYVSPTGRNRRNGSSPAKAVRSLDRVEQLVPDNANVNVQVRIKPGTYKAYRSTYWTKTVRGTITFLPTNDPGGSGKPTGALPTFVGPTGAAGKAHGAYWFTASPRRATGAGQGFHFRHLEVRNYSNGIAIEGGTKVVGGIRRGDATPANDNSFVGMRFYRLGDRYNYNGSKPSDPQSVHVGQYGVSLSNSSYDTFRGNSFRLLEGVEQPAKGSQLDLLHAIYAKDGSHRLTITGNWFQVVSGAVIKARNNTYSNTISRNTFYHAGSPSDGAYYDRVEHYGCSSAGVPAGCTTSPPSSGWECPSHGARFAYNRISALTVSGERRWTGYRGQVMPLFKRSPFSTTSKGGPGCSNVVGGRAQPWLTTSGNRVL